VYATLNAISSSFINTVIKNLQAANTRATTQDEIDKNNSAIRAWFTAQVNITGHSVQVAVLLNNTFANNPNDLIGCQVLKVSDDEKIDVSLLQTNTKTLPAQVKNLVDINDVVPDNELKPGKKIYILGFPMGLILANTTQGIKANFQDGQVSRETDGYAFGHNISSIGGASGSPVFDEDGRLAGVHYSGIRGNTQGFKFAVIGSQVKKFTLQ
jgi:S1-C subfamily serine protease